MCISFIILSDPLSYLWFVLSFLPLTFTMDELVNFTINEHIKTLEIFLCFILCSYLTWEFWYFLTIYDTNSIDHSNRQIQYLFEPLSSTTTFKFSKNILTMLEIDFNLNTTIGILNHNISLIKVIFAIAIFFFLPLQIISCLQWLI